MQHLVDFFDRYVRGRSTALIHDDGFRCWSYTSDQLRGAAERFADRLAAAGVGPGDRVMISGANQPEWVAAFWGCILRGAALVPLDPGASADLIRRIVRIARPRVIVTGDEVSLPDDLGIANAWRLREMDWPSIAPESPALRTSAARAIVGPDTVAEIVFTSGTTGDPKGVVITHRNIVANITPIERVAVRYRRFIWPLRPLRFLGLLPLSHMFGQAITMFLPRLVDGTTVFINGYHPGEIIRQIRRHHVTLAATIPRAVELIRNRVRSLAPSCAEPTAAQLPLLRRLWMYRDARRLFGWRFCGFVLGGAPLDRELEGYWRRLGFAVIQGYGLTESAPIVTWNQPFSMQHGTVGRPLEGIEVRIAADGEILVRGPSVTRGYLDAPEATQSAFEGGWFHTGDIGAFDHAGNLVIRGRKKDVIVTAEGLKVFPEDVERVLDSIAGVRESAVVARTNGGEHVHAVLVLDPGIDPRGAVTKANAALESYQWIRDFSIWPGSALPRTEALHKLKRHTIQKWVSEGVRPAAEQARPTGIERVLSRHLKIPTPGSNVTLDELGLTSLDRIDLAMAIDEQTGTTAGESAVAAARTVADLRQIVAEAEAARAGQAVLRFPRWATSLPARLIRDLSLPTWILPVAGLFLNRRVEGLEHLDRIRGPVIFAANHQSHFDTPAILLCLPSRWRRRVAVAMAREFFNPYFNPEPNRTARRIGFGALYALAALFFNTFPLPRTGPGAPDSLRYAGELASHGWSLLVFPEGHRTIRGEISAFQPGIGMMASRLRLPVIPVRLEGLDRVLHQSERRPHRGAVRVCFGAPLTIEGDDYAALAHRVEAAVVALSGDPGTLPQRDAA